MGKIKVILNTKELPERELHNSRMFVDLSENVHIHFRDLRLMFGVEEFFEFADILREGTSDIRRYLKKNPGYREQEIFDGIMVAGGSRRQLVPLRESPEPHTSKYFPNRLQIELQDEKVIDSIHIHYRDYRLALNIETFRELAEGMKSALEKLEDLLREKGYRPEEHPFRKVVEKDQWRADKMTGFQKLKYRIKRILGRTETNG
jgi:hypothetical protein